MNNSEIIDTVGAFVPGPRVQLDGAGTGPLAGLHFAVKDVFDIPGSVSSFGQPTWLATHSEAKSLAAAVGTALDAGATLVGKTVCDEMCYSLTGENVHYGSPVNVNAPGRVAGGSSSGSAAAVAAGLVDFAFGTDCGGSVRIPASYCGIYGLRPTHGRVPTDGVLPFGPPFDVVGWFARDAATFSKVSDVMLGSPAPESDTPLRRLLFPIEAWLSVNGSIAKALGDSAAAIEANFDVVDRIDLSPEGLATWGEAFRVLQADAIWTTLGTWVQEAQPQFGPGIAERFRAAADTALSNIEAAEKLRMQIRARLDDALGDDGVLCLPTAPHIAPLRGAPVDDVELGARARAMRLLCMAGLGGLPQVSIPGAVADGNPIGISLVGPPGSDRTIVAQATSVSTAVNHHGEFGDFLV